MFRCIYIDIWNEVCSCISPPPLLPSPSTKIHTVCNVMFIKFICTYFRITHTRSYANFSFFVAFFSRSSSLFSRFAYSTQVLSFCHNTISLITFFYNIVIRSVLIYFIFYFSCQMIFVGTFEQLAHTHTHI